MIITVLGIYVYDQVAVGGVGAVSFPASLDTFTNPSATDTSATVSHSGQHSDANDAIAALQTKVGADSSGVTSTLTYKLSGVTGSDVAASLTGTETLTNKTLTTPNTTGIVNTSGATFTGGLTSASTTLTGSTTISLASNPFQLDLGSDATGDLFYRSAGGLYTRLGVGSTGQFLRASSTGLPGWETASANAPTVISTTTTSFSISPDGSTLYVINVHGTQSGDGSDQTVSLKFGGTTLTSVLVDVGSSADDDPFAMTYADTFAATTTNLSISTTGGSLSNIRFTVQKFSS